MTPDTRATPRPGSQEAKEANKQRAVELWDGGQTMRSISREMDKTVEYVRRLLIEAGRWQPRKLEKSA